MQPNDGRFEYNHAVMKDQTDLHEKDVHRIHYAAGLARYGTRQPEFIGQVYIPARCWQDYPETIQVGDALYRRDDSNC